MRPSCIASLFAVFLVLVTGCRDDPAISAHAPPPRADFIVAAGDSAFWVSTVGNSLRIRGAPLELVRVDGRFHELYVVDHDRSYADAILVGERVYLRDLLRGDSVLVYEDTLVRSLASEYARLHPELRPLGPDDEANDEPFWRATATLELGAVHGRFASFSLHTDVERGSGPLWHTTRAGVIDLRERRAATLLDLAADGVARVERLRTVALRAAMDSVRSTRDERGGRAAASLAHYRLDPASFQLTVLDGLPAVTYALPGAGIGDAGHLLPLSPIMLTAGPWWPEVLSTLPVASDDGRRDVWRHGRYDVVIRYGSAGDAVLTVRDSSSREWPVGQVSAPAARIYWLDTPVIEPPVRLALEKAFRDADSYDAQGGAAIALASVPNGRGPARRR